MKWAERVTRLGETGNHTEFWYGKLKKRDYVEDLDVDGRMTSKFIFMKWSGGERCDQQQPH